jgi:hypothetical protein
MYNVVILHSAQCTPSVHWASVHWVAIYTGCTLGGNVHLVDIVSGICESMYPGSFTSNVHQVETHLVCYRWLLFSPQCKANIHNITHTK